MLRLFPGKEPGVCPYCGYDDTEEQPFLALPPGTILNGRYMAGKVLGVGGFGITYLGYDLTLEIKVAIKEYMPSGMATRYKDGYTVTLTGRVEKEYAAGMERFWMKHVFWPNFKICLTSYRYKIISRKIILRIS